ncbi:hypothetical protein FHX42_005074 [Saccharopolyspora lacisalsi]|uniref:Uncharacterized protein n=1 Tax=Halosaccharopolyspora lacisalsi TaxID=1000566 RepID=A0A839E486_9PSEU|nr:hypothetical protein [Halosaccharopolyspora lacisalsi]MBA8827669.1 hypothetical protein [Halosaccharopolyspora lacisalsi]
MAGLAILVLGVFAAVAVLLVTPRDADDGVDDPESGGVDGIQSPRSAERSVGTSRDNSPTGMAG